MRRRGDSARGGRQQHKREESRRPGEERDASSVEPNTEALRAMPPRLPALHAAPCDASRGSPRNSSQKLGPPSPARQPWARRCNVWQTLGTAKVADGLAALSGRDPPTPSCRRLATISLIRSSVSSDIRRISQWVSFITRIGEVAITSALRGSRSIRPISPIRSPSFERGDLLAVLDHVGGPLLDRDQLGRVIALLHQDLPLGHARLGRERGQTLRLLVREVGEDRDLLQAVGIHRRSGVPGAARANPEMATAPAPRM